jgi:hypothetical protein
MPIGSRRPNQSSCLKISNSLSAQSISLHRPVGAIFHYVAKGLKDNRDRYKFFVRMTKKPGRWLCTCAQQKYLGPAGLFNSLVWIWREQECWCIYLLCCVMCFLAVMCICVIYRFLHLGLWSATRSGQTKLENIQAKPSTWEAVQASEAVEGSSADNT